MCKIFLNIFEKGVDFFEQREYNVKAVARTAWKHHKVIENQEKTSKKFEKPLDKSKTKWYNK